MLHKDLMDAERQWAVTNGIPHADVIDAMDLSRQNLVTWVHLNAAGNRVIASVLSNTILQKLDTEVTIEEREGPYRPRQSVAPESR
jgi:hypothetical protein